MSNPADLTEEEQKRVGTPLSGTMGDRHRTFVETIAKLMETNAIDPTRPETFIRPDVYQALEPTWKIKTDRILPNMATLLTHIHAFYRDHNTPNACPQLANMIEQLWEMKERIEVHADVFLF